MRRPLVSLTAPCLALAGVLALAVPSPAASSEPAATPAGSQQAFWDALQALCGNAYAGALRHGDAVDADLAGQPMVMHVRTCTDERVEIPFHVGEDRSRTWVLTRTEGGLRLKHDHRHQDGNHDEVTLYGGDSEGPGTASEQRFPADAHSRELFTRTGSPQSNANVWSVELVPGERFSYALRRPGRHFQVDFDLRQPVPAPPAPWGW
jgi:hypothetical protein